MVERHLASITLNVTLFASTLLIAAVATSP